MGVRIKPSPIPVWLTLQEKQKKEAAASSGKGVKQSAGELRLQKGESVAQPCCLHLPVASDCTGAVVCRHLGAQSRKGHDHHISRGQGQAAQV